MTQPTYQTLAKEFDEFDRLILPGNTTLKAAQRAHLDVRRRIANDPWISEIHVADFLQGSYARHTMVKPPLDVYGQPEKADVDIVLVTNLSEFEFKNPETVLQGVLKWLEKEYGKGRAKIQSRSVKLSLPDVEVDLVPTSAPSEAQKAALRRYTENAVEMETRSADHDDEVLNPDEIFGPEGLSDDQWVKEPLRIPDKDAREWQDTHPLATLDFAVQKNKDCNSKFLRIARALKWWRRRAAAQPGASKYPRSYPIEHMAGDYCPHNFSSIAEGLTMTFQAMKADFDRYHPHSKPQLRPRGLDEEESEADVISRLTQDDFNAFYKEVCHAAETATKALSWGNRQEAAEMWQGLLGKEFKIPLAIPTSSAGPAGAAAGTTVMPTDSPSPRGRFG
ncbi:hypothetical protein HNQ07_004079 [Deinococcus metalli]|uniref:Nucleotidyltransferase n=1 Tax=Deinococcus metalli TaxID=1141878 RepID=A0A7W8KI81_9DEIO|nr:hypothetical protein [Deinococcus metalli]MBB5378572.1 hypothetical protein [Deinococcus metalli]GHF58711.1 nucleotidyltransferase [Deinococcus metalli]